MHTEISFLEVKKRSEHEADHTSISCPNMVHSLVIIIIVIIISIIIIIITLGPYVFKNAFNFSIVSFADYALYIYLFIYIYIFI
jgi:hypothetical protein